LGRTTAKFEPEAAHWHALTGDFYCVDAGSRGGFWDLPRLHPWLHMYSVDADAAAAVPPQKFASFHHFPVALYSSAGEMELSLTAQPGMSSLLEFDAPTFMRHFGLMPGSASWRQGFAERGRRKTPTQTADALLRREGLARVDFMKLDTQGTELELLKGAREYLGAGQISVIKTEVSFLPVYRKQCTFSEVDQFLKQHGFIFVDCVFYPDIVDLWTSPKAVEGTSLAEQARFSAVGDAVYLLRPDCYSGDDRAGFVVRAAVVLNQLGYVSLAFDLLKSEAYPIDLAEGLLRATAAPRPSRLNQALKDHLPPWAYRKARQLSRWMRRQGT
jgi:FkbM family methyltransferase